MIQVLLMKKLQEKISIITPFAEDDRGCQLSIVFNQDVEPVNEKLKKNTGKPVKKMVKTDVLAGHLNMLDMYGWYTDLIDEYEEALREEEELMAPNQNMKFNIVFSSKRFLSLFFSTFFLPNQPFFCVSCTCSHLSQYNGSQHFEGEVKQITVPSLN